MALTQIAEQLSRIESAKGVLLDKALDLKLDYYDPDEGIATKRPVKEDDTLDKIADAFEQIPEIGAVTHSFDANSSDGVYEVPQGYHNGKGMVYVWMDADKYVTPNKQAQEVTGEVLDDGTQRFLTKVIVNPIPDEYQDITGVTATASDVLTGKKFIGSDGSAVDGTMTDQGAFNDVLGMNSVGFFQEWSTIPAGYHNGNGRVYLNPETKTATPTKSSQTINPSSGKVLRSVTVNAIPDEYQDVTAVTATAADVLTGKKIVNSDGTVIDGTITNHGAIQKEIDLLDETGYIIAAGYTSGASVTINSNLLTRLTAI